MNITYLTSFILHLILMLDECFLKCSGVVVSRAIHDVKATDMGLSKVRFKAEVDFDGRVVTRSYLEKQDIDQILNVSTLPPSLINTQMFMDYIYIHNKHISTKPEENQELAFPSGFFSILQLLIKVGMHKYPQPLNTLSTKDRLQWIFVSAGHSAGEDP